MNNKQLFYYPRFDAFKTYTEFKGVYPYYYTPNATPNDLRIIESAQ